VVESDSLNKNYKISLRVKLSLRGNIFHGFWIALDTLLKRESHLLLKRSKKPKVKKKKLRN